MTAGLVVSVQYPPPHVERVVFATVCFGTPALILPKSSSGCHQEIHQGSSSGYHSGGVTKTSRKHGLPADEPLQSSRR